MEFELYSNYDSLVSLCVCVKVGLCICSGLEDQLLGLVVAEERPDLEGAKNQLIISNAKMQQELKEIEDEVLFRLSSTEGNPVDNEELIQVLGASKIKAGEIKVRHLTVCGHTQSSEMSVAYVFFC